MFQPLETYGTWQRHRDLETRPDWPVYRCAKCGQYVEIRSTTQTVAEVLDSTDHCDAATENPRPPLQMATTYATAVARWIAAGFPRRSDDEVDQIFEICRACKWMHAAGYCQKCGCRLSKSRQAMTNKIRMATEHCPLPDQKW